MKTPSARVAMLLSISGVLVAGSAAALVNSQVLDEQSDGWTLRRVESAGDGRSMLDYEVKLNKRTTREVLLRRILTRGRPHVVGVELV